MLHTNIELTGCHDNYQSWWYRAKYGEIVHVLYSTCTIQYQAFYVGPGPDGYGGNILILYWHDSSMIIFLLFMETLHMNHRPITVSSARQNQSCYCSLGRTTVTSGTTTSCSFHCVTATKIEKVMLAYLFGLCVLLFWWLRCDISVGEFSGVRDTAVLEKVLPLGPEAMPEDRLGGHASDLETETQKRILKYPHLPLLLRPHFHAGQALLYTSLGTNDSSSLFLHLKSNNMVSLSPGGTYI